MMAITDVPVVRHAPTEDDMIEISPISKRLMLNTSTPSTGSSIQYSRTLDGFQFYKRYQKRFPLSICEHHNYSVPTYIYYVKRDILGIIIEKKTFVTIGIDKYGLPKRIVEIEHTITDYGRRMMSVPTMFNKDNINHMVNPIMYKMGHEFANNQIRSKCTVEKWLERLTDGKNKIKDPVEEDSIYEDYLIKVASIEEQISNFGGLDSSEINHINEESISIAQDAYIETMNEVKVSLAKTLAIAKTKAEKAAEKAANRYIRSNFVE